MSSYPVHHIVLFKYKDSTDEEQKLQIAKDFEQLATDCVTKEGKPYIGGISSGSQNNSERRSKGLEHGFTVLFKDAAERDYYLFEDEVHSAFKKKIGSHLEDVISFDYTDGVVSSAIV